MKRQILTKKPNVIISSQKSNTSDYLIFIITSFLLTWEVISTFFIFNRDLLTPYNEISGTIRFGPTYIFSISLILLSIKNQFYNKTFKYTWAIPIIYMILCFYAWSRAEGRSVNNILGFIFRPIAGVSCMLSFEYLFSKFKNDYILKLIDVLFFSLYLISFIFLLHQLFFSSKYWGEFLAINNVYFFIPLTFYWMTKKNFFSEFLQYLTLAISFASLKRGAILAMAAIFSAKFLLKDNKKEPFLSFIHLTISLTIVFTIGIIIDDFLFKGFLSERFESISDGSGRANQFSWAINELKESSFFSLMIGHGMGASQLKFYGQFIHNDWLLLLYDFGLIGLIIYSFLYFFLIKIFFNLNKFNSPYLLPWVSCCLFISFLSLYSAVTWLYIFNVLPVLGCLIGLERKRLNDYKYSKTINYRNKLSRHTR